MPTKLSTEFNLVSTDDRRKRGKHFFLPKFSCYTVFSSPGWTDYMGKDTQLYPRLAGIPGVDSRNPGWPRVGLQLFHVIGLSSCDVAAIGNTLTTAALVPNYLGVPTRSISCDKRIYQYAVYKLSKEIVGGCRKVVFYKGVEEQKALTSIYHMHWQLHALRFVGR